MECWRIFLVEDDPVISGAVAAHLRTWGYTVIQAADFQNVLAEFVAADPQLVLLDVSLPFYNGYHWCEEIRKLSKAPILFLSSASDNMNQVMAMTVGGDDFLAKPFDLTLLSAKVQALLRRAYDFGAPARLAAWGGAVVNLSNGSVSAGGVRVELTKNETRILQMLLENRGRVVSRESLMARLWESDAFVDENTLTVNVARLRKKLEGLGLSGEIRTKKGAGYWVEG